MATRLQRVGGWFQRQLFGPGPEEMIAYSRAARSQPVVNADTALRHSAVWACVRLRADLVSTMPVDAFREGAGGVKLEVSPKPPMLSMPGGERVDIMEWLWSSQSDLDRSGNTVGLITALNGAGKPAAIELQPLSEVTVRVKDGKLTKYKIGNKEYDPPKVWHEKQYTASGMHVGLSPVAYAAYDLDEYASIQQFAMEWFSNSRVPASMLRNTQKTIPPKAAQLMKERFKATVQHGDVLVTGADWEYSLLGQEQSSTDWLEAKDANIADIARFFNCPMDAIEAAVKGQSVTYANIVQKNLQFLIHNLNPTLRRRELAMSTWLPTPRYVRFNRGGLLEMDPASQAEMFKVQIESRQKAPSEVRTLLDLQPYTDSQLAEFDRLFGPPKSANPEVVAR